MRASHSVLFSLFALHLRDVHTTTSVLCNLERFHNFLYLPFVFRLQNFSNTKNYLPPEMKSFFTPGKVCSLAPLNSFCMVKKGGKN